MHTILDEDMTLREKAERFLEVYSLEELLEINGLDQVELVMHLLTYQMIDEEHPHAI